MRTALSAIGIAAGWLAVMAPAPGQAQSALEASPWCAEVATGADNVERHCIYESFEACVPEVIAGNRGFCIPNPQFAAVSEPPPVRRRAPRHRHRVRPG